MSNDNDKKKIKLRPSRIRMIDPPVRMIQVIKLDSLRDRLQLPKSAGN